MPTRHDLWLLLEGSPTNSIPPVSPQLVSPVLRLISNKTNQPTPWFILSQPGAPSACPPDAGARLQAPFAGESGRAQDRYRCDSDSLGDVTPCLGPSWSATRRVRLCDAPIRAPVPCPGGHIKLTRLKRLRSTTNTLQHRQSNENKRKNTYRLVDSYLRQRYPTKCQFSCAILPQPSQKDHY